MFIEEMGKTGVTTLLRPNMEIAARMTAGDLVNVAAATGSLAVRSLQDELIGEVEPRLAQRLIKLIQGGNQYVAAIAGLSDGEVRVFIRETFQAPNQIGKLSFPPTVTETFRPYVKERLVRKDAADEPYYESDENDDWETRPQGDEAEETIQRFTGSSAADEEDEEDTPDTDDEE
jgi:hypothetical protein